MANQLKAFKKYVGQTSPYPIELEIERAEGVFYITTSGKEYFDFTSGIAVNNLGHGNERVIKAITKQAKKNLHTMVYGEFVESPQVDYAKLLVKQLPKPLNSLYYCTSGSEAVEASMKLAKRKTQRTEIIYFKGAYHGSTHGALSIMGSEEYKEAYRPLLPGNRMCTYNSMESIEQITEKTAGVIVEVAQAASGVTVAKKEWLKALREQCDKTGALLIFDEIQTGFGRTGKLFAFEHFNVVPDVLLIAKAMGGGIPIGGLVANRKLLKLFTKQPILGHINTFGGNAIACAAAKATLQELTTNTKLLADVERKANYIKDHLGDHDEIEKISNMGLLIALHFKSKEKALAFMNNALKQQIVLIGFLLNDNAVRLAPPLTISTKELKKAVNLLQLALDDL